MRNTAKLIASCVVVTSATGLFAQVNQVPVAQNVVQLSANGSIDVAQDLLTMVLGTNRDGADAATVQSQLKVAVDAALLEAKKSAQPGQMDLRTGAFSLYPRYGKDGKPIGWQGTAELIVEGRDFARISTLAGKIRTLTVSSVSFSLSTEQRTQVEAQAQALAIERFKTNASLIAKGFGFSSYSLREVNVNSNEQGYAPAPRMMAMASKMAMDEAPVPVVAGKTSVVVNVSGSVQLK